MEIENVFVQKDRYYNAIQHTLKILRFYIRSEEAAPALIRPLPLNLR